jgi:hypothetical protein
MSEPFMNPKTTSELTTALRPWVNDALAYIKERPDLWAELVKCMTADGDVRVVFHIRANAITVEAADYTESTVAELFRQQIVPEDGFGHDIEWTLQ